MKIRIKFEKQGQVKFVGHLDTLRLFQRAIKVAKIPIAYSQGFNPHSLVYFAMPLSVGVSSTGEYMDMVTQEAMRPEEVKTKLNAVLVEGIKITDAFLIEESTASLMSLVEAASYEIVLYKKDFKELQAEKLREQLNQEELTLVKKTKKGTKIIDIKPMILSWQVDETETACIIDFTGQAGSRENLSPRLLAEACLKDQLHENIYIAITRQELYAHTEEGYVPLDHYRRKP